MRKLGGVVLGEQAGRAVDIEGVGATGLQHREGVAKLADERRLRGGQLAVAHPILDHPRAKPEAAETLVQVARSPLDEPRIDLAPEREDALGHRPVGGDDHDEDDPRRQPQDLDPMDPGR